MFVLDGVVVYSASDLASAAGCEYALLRAFDGQLGRGPAALADDPLLQRTARLGDEHEGRHLAALRSAVGDDVAVIGRPAYTRAALAAAVAQTRAAVDRRAPVIAQAAMFDGRFLGFADFLILADGGYRLRDTKLARSVKVTALLQLAAYADALRADGVAVLDTVELGLGDATVVPYPVGDLVPVYRARRAALQDLLDRHHAGGAAVRWGDETVRVCLRCPECLAQIAAHDDVLRVAGMRTTQRARLIEAGITTMARLAGHRGSIPGLSDAAAAALTSQARLQAAAAPGRVPGYEVTDAAALSGLPPPSPGDVFFDFEGDPLWTADGRNWGLEYLFGMLHADGRFEPLWADDRRQERDALRSFLDIVRDRRERYPDMHVYHYASYEKTALLRLSGSYGVGEEELDDLLRANVLIDLYPLVRNSIRVGTPGYSLKDLEPLYMGEQLRTGEVTTASDSILRYHRYSDRRAEGDTAQAAAEQAAILDYNEYDCRSTRGLRDFLLARAAEHGVAHRPPPAPREKKADPIDQDDTARALMGFAGDELDERTPEQQAVAMIAAARGYHQRESKPYWWGHFQRMEYPTDEWADTSGVFLVQRAEVEQDWCEPQGRQRKSRRRLRLHGVLDSGRLGSTMTAVYAPPAPSLLPAHSSGKACNAVSVDPPEDPDNPCELTITELLPGSLDSGTYPQLPFALTPPPPVTTDTLRDALDAVATEVVTGLAAAQPTLPAVGYVDVLLRRPPRTRSGRPLPRTGDDIADITAAVLDLDRSYLAVHGPPGCGKTHSAARVITDLVGAHGWRVGVVAQSHHVVENLLEEIIGAGTPGDRVGKKLSPSARDEPRRWQAVQAGRYPEFIGRDGGRVIGGTAWDFANPQRVPPGSLDLMVVEEAGQFCLAHTIAVAPAARNLLLLGDPQQLPQVSQGTHAEPVDASALGWLVDGAPTLDPSLGYFLARSWRMHPAVCGPVSRYAYGGRLAPEAVAAKRRLHGRDPGVHEILVPHRGNATDSPEEAARVVAEIAALLGSTWFDGTCTRALGPDDILVVAAYNAQVQMIRRRLAQAGLAGVRVGTVDKFQGRQAPVVFFSMAASSVADVPRGISFLLNRNRVNVALSRAQYAAYVVRSPQLTEFLPAGPAGLVELGGFLGVTGSVQAVDGRATPDR